MTAALDTPDWTDAPLAERQTQTSRRLRDRMADWLSWGLSLFVLAVVVNQLASFGLDRLYAMLPATPAFYIILVALYITLPLSEMVIFQRVWQAPAAIFAPLLRKAVINDLVVNYGGELYLYRWARRHVRSSVLPFGAIKDVSILSAAVGNVLTLATLAVAAPWLGDLLPPKLIGPLWGSVAILSAVPLLLAIFSRKVFSLTSDERRFVIWIHLVRILASSVLMALLWSCVLPEVPATYWFALQSLRLLVSRLPLLPNKDMLFASIAVSIVGQQSSITALLSLTAMATLGLHLLTFVGLSLKDGLRAGRQP